MAHEITIDKADDFAKVSYANHIVPWHRLGHSWPTDANKMPTEAFEETRLKFRVVKAPYVVELPDGLGQIKAEDYALVKLPLPGDPDSKPVILGVVGENYEALDNMRIASVLDGLAKHLPLEVVGSLRGDRIIFATFKADNIAILVNGKQDEVGLHLLFLEDKTPGHGVQFNLSGVCTVCMNTVTSALDLSKLNISLGHTYGVGDRLEWTAQTLQGVASRQAAIKDAMQQLAFKPIGKAQANKIFDAASPMPEKPLILRLAQDELSKFPKEEVDMRRDRWERDCDLASAYYRKFQDVYATETEAEGRAGNAWGAYNAVTSVCDHHNVGKRDLGHLARAESAMLGKRYEMKLRAWNAAMAIESV